MKASLIRRIKHFWKINGKKFRATDTRKTKHGIEVDTEVASSNGGATVKFFGPNKKKDYTVVINKTKDHRGGGTLL